MWVWQARAKLAGFGAERMMEKKQRKKANPTTCGSQKLFKFFQPDTSRKRYG
jgi:hypothetical protein